jgi:hypothetical protein
VKRIAPKLMISLGILGTLVLFFRWYSRPPAVEYDNLRYIQLLTTAVSARNGDWLEKVDTAVQQRHHDGQMSEAELAHFSRLISQAQSGEWEAADRACFAFAESQLGRRRSKPPGEGHNHD